MKTKATKKKKYTFIDLFAGIGGFRIAFQKNGAKCVYSSEWDENCKKTYKENFYEIPDGDITKVDPKAIPNHNILTGGFPCQPFSTIGKRQGFEHPTQGTLFFDVVKILKEKKPEAFLLENVSGLKSHDGGNTLKVIKDTLKKELGYQVFIKVLDAANYGVPQHRKRVYLVGFSKEATKDKKIKFKFPKKNKTKVGIGKYVESLPTGYCISKHLQETYLYKVNDGRPQVITKKSNIPVKTLVATYHKIQRLTGTFVKDGDTGLRLLSENECKAIMGFPKNYKFPVSRTQMYHQMGNSVAVPVVKKIAKLIVKKLDKLKI